MAVTYKKNVNQSPNAPNCWCTILLITILSVGLIVLAVIAIIIGILSSPIGSFSNPAPSCSAISGGRPSGLYWVQTSGGVVQLYCDMERRNCSCNDATSTGGWLRVANINMRDPDQSCPPGFQLRATSTGNASVPFRVCGRTQEFCSSTILQTYGVPYSHVCGRIIAYQDGAPDAFARYNIGLAPTLEDGFVDGIVLTTEQRGLLPAQHIWTFAGAIDEVNRGLSFCPCINLNIDFPSPPPFIGQDYFCDTASRGPWEWIFYPDDPLWDGQGCGGASICCQFNNPPWFCKQLPQPTTQDIRLRSCGDQGTGDEGTPFEIVEIYVS